MTRFLFERQQQADGSMPRNSLPNGKLAPDSFNTQLDECAYPLVMALAVGLTDNAYYKAHIAPAANFVASPRPVARAPSAGRSRAASRRRPSRPRSPGLIAAAIIADKNGDHASARVWRGVADEFQRNLKKWTLTTNGPLSTQPVLHPPVEDRRPQRGHQLQRRQRRPDARPARDHRRRLPRVRAPRPAEGRRRRHPRLAAGRRRDDQAQHRQRRRLPALQRRRLRRRRDRRPSVGAVEQGQRPPVAGAGRRARPVRDRPRLGRRGDRAPGRDAQHELGRRPHRRAGVGAARPRGVAVRHRPDDRLDRLPQRQARRLGLRPDVVGRPVRAPDARHGRRARSSTARPTPSTATSATRRARPR